VRKVTSIGILNTHTCCSWFGRSTVDRIAHSRQLRQKFQATWNLSHTL